MTWKAWDHQKEIATQAIEIIKEHMIVYLAMEERTGKCVTAIITVEDLDVIKPLVLTTKKALDGWDEALNNFLHWRAFKVVNYHQAHKLADEYDIVILDEPHNYLAAYPKTSKMWKEVARLCKDKPIIYTGATPYAQGPQMLYHQLALSSWSPWRKFRNFYEWFKHYAVRDRLGNFKVKYIGPSQTAIDYTAVDKDKVLDSVKHLFITKTRKELGFEHEPEDRLHYIDLSEATRRVYNAILKDGVLEFTSSISGNDYLLVCDSSIKLRTSLHMLEGGGLKINGEDVELGNTEKIDYILETWGDTEDLVIMYQYIVEGIKLRRRFKNAKILQGDSFAEGVDLSGHRHLVIYSMSFRTSKHVQRRARQANKNRDEEITVHYLLVARATSEQVYKTVAINKTNFVDSVFEREEI